MNRKALFFTLSLSRFHRRGHCSRAAAVRMRRRSRRQVRRQRRPRVPILLRHRRTDAADDRQPRRLLPATLRHRPPPVQPPPPTPAPTGPFEINVGSPATPVTSSGVTPKLTTFATGLNTPWGMAFLPDGRLLVTQKGGTLVLVSADGTSIGHDQRRADGRFRGPGRPARCRARSAVQPEHQSAHLPRVLRARRQRNQRHRGRARRPECRADRTRERARSSSSRCRRRRARATTAAAWCSATDGTLFVTLGERQMPISPTNEAQSLTSQLGKVVRINTDGSIPADNPYASNADAAHASHLELRPPQSAGRRAESRRRANSGSPSTARRAATK